MQPLGLTAAQNAAYLDRLFGSHDYRIDCEILNLNEQVIGTVALEDGQVNIQDSTNTVRRTATLTVSDPAGALDYTDASAWSGTTVWVDRLIRIRHTIHVPALGRDISVIPFVGPPATITRDGADVAVECQDKTALAVRGASPYTVPKGTNAVTAIRNVLAHCTGEFRFRLGTTAKRITKPYAVGWSDAASPWVIAKQIAGEQLGADLLYSCDGYVLLRHTPTTVGLVAPHVTALPSAGVDFTTLSNWVQVNGKATSSKSGNTTVTRTPQAVASVSSGPLSPTAMARKGVKRYLPMVVTVGTATTFAQVAAEANRRIQTATKLQAQPQMTCVPFFHADADDMVKFTVPGNDETVRLTTASIPLGASEMTVGAVAWVSKPPGHKTTARTVTTRK